MPQLFSEIESSQGNRLTDLANSKSLEEGKVLKTSKLVAYLFVLFSLSKFLSAQPFPVGREKEVGFPLPYLSPVTGTFAEIRNHNLHLGSDFKSYGLNGHSVLATFDGYVDEISFSQIGYGLSFHLYSPELKLKSKYAHLHSFQGNLKDFEELRSALLLLGEKEGFSLKLPPNQFGVKKGTPIAKTGESGSGISHLHLEFRTDKGTVNPLSFPDFQHKDDFPPTIQSLLLESDDSGKSVLLKATEHKKNAYKLTDESGEEVKLISLGGKVRVRISGFDRIRSRNKNNVYGMNLKINEKVVFSRTFDFLNYEDGIKKHQYYDLNRSSLSPPMYFYHLYERPKDFSGEGYSFDLSAYEEGAVIDLEASLLDAAKNQSSVFLQIKNESPDNKENIKPTKKIAQKDFKSEDQAIRISFSKATPSGNGKLLISSYEKEAVFPFLFPKGIRPISKIYKFETQNLSWKGEADGEFTFKTSPKDVLFFWDSSSKKYQGIIAKKKANGFSFSLTKVGYLFIAEDEAPPSVFPMTTLARNIELPDVQDPCFEIRYYALSDTGVGFRTNVDLLLDGQTFPYEYDPDRKAVRVVIPKILAEKQKFLLAEVKGFDFAGNVSPTFFDLISTEGWKNESSYASCPAKE